MIPVSLSLRLLMMLLSPFLVSSLEALSCLYHFFFKRSRTQLLGSLYVRPSQHHQLTPVLLAEKFVLVRKDASVPSLALSVDWLKPAFSKDPISAALLPAWGCPASRPPLSEPDPLPSPSSATIPARGSARKDVWFQLPSTVSAQRNPR